MNNEKNAGRAVAGFFLTLITIIMFIGGGILGSLKLSILNGSDVDEFLDNINFYSTVQEIVVTEIKDQISDNNTNNVGLTENAVDKVLTEDIIKDMTNSITDAITKDEEIDFGNVKDKCIDKVTDLSNQAVDDILDEISRTSDVVDIDTLQSSTTLQQYQQEYNIDITSLIVNEIENAYGEPSVSLEKIDIDEVKDKAKSAVIDSAVPMIEESLDTYIDAANRAADTHIKSIKENGVFSRLTGALKVFMSLANIAFIVLLAVSVAASLIQIFVVYKSDKNRAFRNISIAAVVSAAVMIVFGAVFNIAKNMIVNLFGDGKSDDIIRKFAEDNISKVSVDIFFSAVIFAVIFVVTLSISVFVKKRAEK